MSGVKFSKIRMSGVKLIEIASRVLFKISSCMSGILSLSEGMSGFYLLQNMNVGFLYKTMDECRVFVSIFFCKSGFFKFQLTHVGYKKPDMHVVLVQKPDIHV